METKKIIIQKLKLLGLLKNTEFIFLFGSVASKKNTPLSDIDLCVSLSLPPKERLQARIKLLGQLPDKYDLQIFEDLPIYVQKEVLSGKLLYFKNHAKVVERALEIIQEYEDFKPIYDYYLAKDKSKVEI